MQYGSGPVWGVAAMRAYSSSRANHNSSGDRPATTTSAPRALGRISYGNIGLLVAGVDFALIVAGSLLAGIGYHLFAYHHLPDIGPLLAIGLNCAVVFILLGKSRGLYRPTELLSKDKQFRAVIFSWLMALFVLGSLIFLFKISEKYSRAATVGFGLLALGLLLVTRAVVAAKLARALKQGSLAGRRAVIIGDATELAHVSADHLLEKHGTREIGRYELVSAPDREGGFTARETAVIDAAIEFAQANGAEKVLLALPWSHTRRCQLVCERLRALPLPVLLLPDRFAGSILSQPIRQTGSQLAIELSRAPLSRGEVAIKRALDLALGGAALALLMPLLAVVGIAIKLESRGPALFRQQRMGFNGRNFTICKFRTMTVLENGSAIRQAQPNDVRVTWLGGILRTTSIDELPQLINVLRGEMSLVGPRPHALAHDSAYEETIANYAFRHHVKPGITGWAQVNGLRGETPRVELMMQRVDLDLWYIRNWSIWLDLWILARTCLEVVRARNAY